MFRSIYILRFVSAVLLMLFAVSIAPKKLLHTAFAKHNDNRCKEKSDSPYQLSTSGYNCDIDNQVAESPFENIQQSFSSPLLTSFPSYIVKNISFSSTAGIYSHLRGPPATI